MGMGGGKEYIFVQKCDRPPAYKIKSVFKIIQTSNDNHH